MAEFTAVFERVTRQVEPDADAWQLLERGHRRSARNRKIGAIAVAALFTAIVALLAAKALDRGKDDSAPATQAPRSAMAFAVVDLDGTIRGYLPWRPQGTVTPDISPDGKRVAFAVVKGTVSQIATMRLDRTGLRDITADSVSAIRPRWSPDGSQLLFFQEGRDGILRLMVMNADGSDVRQIRGTHYPGVSPPDWSPDGSLILYTSTASGVDIATVPATGGRSRELTSDVAYEASAAWSPDGRSIAYKRHGQYWEIWVMNADGSGQHRLVALPNANAEAPEWSPDGRKIAFIGSVGGILGNGTGPPGAVYVVDVETGDLTKVMTNVSVGVGFEGRASWMPDGDALLVMVKTT
jgi:Tol biopolymer transport system component